MALRSPPPSGNGIGRGGGGANGCAICWAASIDPAPPGRIEWVLLQTSKFQCEIAPSPSSDAFNLVTIAGPYGSQACSCSRVHCRLTGVPRSEEHTSELQSRRD